MPENRCYHIIIRGNARQSGTAKKSAADDASSTPFGLPQSVPLRWATSHRVGVYNVPALAPLDRAARMQLHECKQELDATQKDVHFMEPALSPPAVRNTQQRRCGPCQNAPFKLC